jgi:putative ABC transport system ATP-binding protein
MNNHPLVELVDVDHEGRTRGITIRGATLRIWRGETVAIHGGPRSGKTTLLRLLAGVVPPTRGTLRYSGDDSRADSGTEGIFRCAGVAFLSQRPSFLLGLTALEHIMVGLFARGLRDETVVKAMAARGLAQMGVSQMSSTLLCDLVPAERRIVLVAEALAIDASLVFVDEGYGSGIAKLAAPHRTLVIVTSSQVPLRVDRTLAIDGHGIVHTHESDDAQAPDTTEAA